MKIVYCIDSIGKTGGREMTTITKANALARIPGNQVWIMVASGEEPPIKKLENVSVVYHNVHYFEEDWKGYWFALRDYFRKVRIYKERVESAMNAIEPDIVISTGHSEKKFFHRLKIVSNPVFIKEIHLEKCYKSKFSRTWRERLLAKMSEWYEYGHTCKKYDKIVLMTEAEKSGSWKNWDKVVSIPNPVCPFPGELSDVESKIAITAGRLHKTKNFPSLINVWKLIHQRHEDWKLQIWGEGEESQTLQRLIEDMELTGTVQLMGYTPDIRVKMSKASLFVLTSLSETFSLVTVEAMSVGLPTVVYHCSGGLGFVVRDGKTGYLVPQNDEEAFADKVCFLIENDNKRKEMGYAALEDSRKYATENIIKQWMALFEELLEKKRVPHQSS